MSEMIRNRYMIVSRLGEGGMADVYLALDTLLNREVAIKVLRGELSEDPINLLRFQREANAASALSHPNIVEIFDVGEEGGKHYIVMEYVRGKTLKQLIAQRGALDKEEAVALMKQLCSGVSEAHKNGIIHRDIKPQNILVKDDGTVKIADFGIATAQNAIQLTQADSVLGSVHYLAPECARGESASEQSDIYSLGIVFYELLTGDLPHTGDAPMQIALKHMREEIPSVRAFNPTLPTSIENIISKSTVKNKVHRYASTKLLCDDLASCLEEKRKQESLVVFESDQQVGETIVIDHVKKAEEPEKKSNLASILMGVGMGVVAIAFTIMMILSLSTPPQPRVVEIPDIVGMTFAQAREELESVGLTLSTSVRYELTDDIDFGLIFAVRPLVSTEVEIGTSISVSISNGKYFVVEDYVGRNIDEVRKLLENRRITIRLEREPNSDEEAGTILRQDILMPNDKLDPTRQYEIRLTIASNIELVLPNLIGSDVDSARATLEDQGVVVNLVQRSTEGMSEEELESITYGVVLEMTPNQGSYYIQHEDASVTLYYY